MQCLVGPQTILKKASTKISSGLWRPQFWASRRNKKVSLRFETYVLLRGLRLLHLDFLLVTELREDAQSVVVVTLLGKVACKFDLLLHFWRVYNDVNRQDTLRRYGLAIWSIRR